MVGHLEKAWLQAVGATEGAFFVAEELAFGEIIGERGTVDIDKRAMAAQGILVDGAGDHFLTGTGFADDEDGGVVARDTLDHGDQLVHGLAADDGDHVSDLDAV